MIEATLTKSRFIPIWLVQRAKADGGRVSLSNDRYKSCEKAGYVKDGIEYETVYEDVTCDLGHTHKVKYRVYDNGQRRRIQ